MFNYQDKINKIDESYYRDNFGKYDRNKKELIDEKLSQNLQNEYN